MYKVLLDGIAIYDPMIGAALTDPVLELADGRSGSFSCGVPPGNPAYGKIKKLVSVIEVLQDDESLFCGRVVAAEKDFYGMETITCEGELALLLDSIQRPHEFHDITVRGFLQYLIDVHNSQVEDGKKFEVGMVTATDSNDSLYRYTNWETTLDDINDKLVSRLGGHIRVRHQDGHRYIDYLADSDNTNTQTIAFGENLLDYTENTTAADLATCIIPLGAAIENDSDDPQALQKYTTCADANGGSDFVSDAEAVKNYGKLFKVVHFDAVTLPTNLKTKGEQYLHETQFEQMTLTVTAVDKHLLNANFERIKVGDRIRCVSKPHGMDRFFPVTKRTIHLDAPEQDTITLGDTVSVSYTERANKDNDTIYQRIDRIPSQSATLKLAQDNATALLTAATTGHVVTRKDEILIMDTDDTATAQHIWRWNVNGWGYSKSGINGPYNLAATMDGAIVADCITTGTMSAERIRAGTLKSQDGTVNFDLDNGKLTVNASNNVFAGKLIFGNQGLQMYDAGGTKPQISMAGIGAGGNMRITAYDSAGTKSGELLLDGQFVDLYDATGTLVGRLSSNDLTIGNQSTPLMRTYRGSDGAKLMLGNGSESVTVYSAADDPSNRDWTIMLTGGSDMQIVCGRDINLNGHTLRNGTLSNVTLENVNLNDVTLNGATVKDGTLSGNTVINGVDVNSCPDGVNYNVKMDDGTAHRMYYKKGFTSQID